MGDDERARRRGKVRWAGVSNFDVELLERCEAIRHVDCVQPELSLLRREALEDVIPWCGAHGTGVIGYSPLGTGALARAEDAATHGQGEGDDALLARACPSRNGCTRSEIGSA